jgi:hypothetical protein
MTQRIHQIKPSTYVLLTDDELDIATTMSVDELANSQFVVKFVDETPTEEALWFKKGFIRDSDDLWKQIEPYTFSKVGAHCVSLGDDWVEIGPGRKAVSNINVTMLDGDLRWLYADNSHSELYTYNGSRWREHRRSSYYSDKRLDLGRTK